MPQGATHQKIASISDGEALLRGRRTKPSWRAARLSQRVLSRVPGKPVSTDNIVAWRRLVFSPRLVWFRPSLRRRRRASPICLGARAIRSMGALQSQTVLYALVYSLDDTL